MRNYFIEQIEYGLSEISQREKTAVIRAIVITKPHNTEGAYLKIDWMTSGDTGSAQSQPYGTPIYPAGNIAEIITEIHEAAAYFGCSPEEIDGSTHRRGPEEAFSNRGHSELTGEDRVQ